jgi:SAM-dependent methyltransferase
MTRQYREAPVSQFHFDPATYADLIRGDVPAYDELQHRVAEASAGVDAGRILDLGAGTGATARAVRTVHPDATIVAVDESARMLELVDVAGVETRVARLQDELPAGPFDLAVSALAVHHLDAAEKRALFGRVREVLRDGGRFVLGDVVVGDVVVAPLSDGYDKPDAALDQVAWLHDAGFKAEIRWEQDDLALIVANC